MGTARETVHCQSVAFGETTWDKTAGIPIRVEFEVQTEEVREYADQLWARFLALTRARAGARVHLREVKVLPTLGSSGSLVLTLNDAAGNTVAITCAAMKLVGVSGSQPQASGGETILEFQHVSSDGTTFPIT